MTTATGSRAGRATVRVRANDALVRNAGTLLCMGRPCLVTLDTLRAGFTLERTPAGTELTVEGRPAVRASASGTASVPFPLFELIDRAPLGALAAPYGPPHLRSASSPDRPLPVPVQIRFADGVTLRESIEVFGREFREGLAYRLAEMPRTPLELPPLAAGASATLVVERGSVRAGPRRVGAGGHLRDVARVAVIERTSRRFSCGWYRSAGGREIDVTAEANDIRASVYERTTRRPVAHRRFRAPRPRCAEEVAARTGELARRGTETDANEEALAA